MSERTTKEIPNMSVVESKEMEMTSFKNKKPEETEYVKTTPDNTELTKENPEESNLNKEMPTESKLNREMPSDVNLDNCIKFNDKYIEIKPTKLKYFRNGFASAYSVIKVVPLNEFLTYDKGVIDPNKDADQVLYDFLVAAFDDPEFVKNNYDDLTAEDVEHIVQIFGRLNHIFEKEEQVRKNREAQAKR